MLMDSAMVDVSLTDKKSTEAVCVEKDSETVTESKTLGLYPLKLRLKDSVTAGESETEILLVMNWLVDSVTVTESLTETVLLN